MRKTATVTSGPLLQRLALSGLALLTLAIPFERIEPRPLCGFAVSELEAVMLGALLLAGAGTLANRRKLEWKTPLTVPFILMFMAFFCSAWFSSQPGVAFRHLGRFAAGFAVYLAVLMVVRKKQWVRLFLILVCTSGIAVSVICVLEYFQLGNLEPVLNYFKNAPFVVGGQVRASGTLQYPTIASMYLEVVFSLGIGLFLWTTSKMRTPALLLGLAFLLLVVQAILTTLSRSGLAILALVLLIAFTSLARAVGWGRQVKVLLLVMGSVVTLYLVNFVADPFQQLRVFRPDQSQWYRAQIRAEHLPEFQAGETATAILLIKNTGLVSWTSDGPNPYLVSYHWLNREGDEAVRFEGLRSEFRKELAPGSEVRLEASVRAPNKPGQYRLTLDVLREGLFWFQSQGSETATIRVQVAETSNKDSEEETVPARTPGRSMETVPPGGRALPERLFSVDRLSLWYAAVLMLRESPLLGVGLGNFKLMYGRFLGFEEWDTRVHSNNTYLEILVSGGLLAAVGLLFFVWRVGSLVWGQMNSPLNSDLPTRLGLALALTAFLVHGLVDYFLEFTPIYVLFWTILGLAHVMEHQGNAEKDESRI